MLTEEDVSRSALQFLRKHYREDVNWRWQLEPVRFDGTRPDAVLVLEWCRGKRDMVHTIESKRVSDQLVSWDRRRVAPAVHQARKYSGNYRWLAVAVEAFVALSRQDEVQLRKDCRRTRHNVGLLICWKTKAQMQIGAGYWPGYWLHHYLDEPWLAGWED